MTDKAQSLVPGRIHLPAAVERRTQIANRLLGELTGRDTEAFFRRHPEFFQLVVSRYYPLSEDLIIRFEDMFDWFELQQNEALSWSEKFILRFKDSWLWELFINNKSLPWSDKLIEKFCIYNYYELRDLGVPREEMIG